MYLTIMERGVQCENSTPNCHSDQCGQKDGSEKNDFPKLEVPSDG